jgi:hypothetical protein
MTSTKFVEYNLETIVGWKNMTIHVEGWYLAHALRENYYLQPIFAIKNCHL